MRRRGIRLTVLVIVAVAVVGLGLVSVLAWGAGRVPVVGRAQSGEPREQGSSGDPGDTSSASGGRAPVAVNVDGPPSASKASSHGVSSVSVVSAETGAPVRGARLRLLWSANVRVDLPPRELIGDPLGLGATGTAEISDEDLDRASHIFGRAPGRVPTVWSTDRDLRALPMRQITTAPIRITPSEESWEWRMSLNPAPRSVAGMTRFTSSTWLLPRSGGLEVVERPEWRLVRGSDVTVGLHPDIHYDVRVATVSPAPPMTGTGTVDPRAPSVIHAVASSGVVFETAPRRGGGVVLYRRLSGRGPQQGSLALVDGVTTMAADQLSGCVLEVFAYGDGWQMPQPLRVEGDPLVAAGSGAVLSTRDLDPLAVARVRSGVGDARFWARRGDSGDWKVVPGGARDGSVYRVELGGETVEFRRINGSVDLIATSESLGAAEALTLVGGRAESRVVLDPTQERRVLSARGEGRVLRAVTGDDTRFLLETWLTWRSGVSTWHAVQFGEVDRATRAVRIADFAKGAHDRFRIRSLDGSATFELESGDVVPGGE